MKDLLKTYFLFFLFGLLFSCAEDNSNTDLIRHASISRSLALLNNSTAEHPSSMYILFYGQSIVKGMKSDRIVDSLKKVFPSADIVHSNKAIGGFTAPSLLKTAEHDIYHTNPDLIVFHAYNGIKDGTLDSLIRSMRKRLSSDILLFDHHFVWDTSQTRLKARNEIDSVESDAIENIAAKYGCGYINLREQWASYLRENNMGANVLIGDTINTEVHPNDEGNKLLRNIILSHILNTDYGNYDEKNDRLRQIVPLKRSSKTNKKRFIGNRLELITDTIVDKETEIQVLIDGSPPSSLRSSYYITRPSIGYKSWMPMIKRIDFGETFPRREDWTLIFYEIDRANKTFSYELEGSITGFDGKGYSDKDFVSDSKRIMINKDDFCLFDIERIIKEETPLEFEVTFKVNALVEDTLVLKPNKLKYTIFRGFDSEKHSLKLKKLNGRSTLKNLLVYKPYLEKDE